MVPVIGMMRLLTIIMLLVGSNEQLKLCGALSNDQIAIQMELMAGQFTELQQELKGVKEKLEHVTKDNVLLRQENNEIKTLLKRLIKDANKPFNRQSTTVDPNEDFVSSSLSTGDFTGINNNDSEGDKHDKEIGQIMERGQLLPSNIKTSGNSGSFDKRLLSTLTTTSPDIPKVAFSAMLTAHPSLGDKQTIEFENVITNVGKGYDPRHGHFIAPVKGVYLMGFSVMNEHGTSGYINMVRNGNAFAHVYLRPSDNSMGTQVVLVVLEQGDMVWVRRTSSVVVQLDGLYNTFSGALLYQL